MNHSSRYNARTWPYPRHAAFERALQDTNAAWFKTRGCAVHRRMPYLLENWEDWDKNIIVEGVAEYIKAERARRSQAGLGFPLHKYLHHGLSSQAMLFNLVGPLLVQGDLSPLERAFARAGIPWVAQAQARFEVEDREIFREDSGQPTSIDLVICGQDGGRALFVEAKLVEREFGGCSVFENGDCEGRSPAEDFSACYLHHLGRRYWDLLKQHGFLEGPLGSSLICPLALYYQFFRELLFAIESGGDFVLLYDQRNPVFYRGERGLVPFLMTFVPQALHGRLFTISIQQICTSYRDEPGLGWLPEFEKKYAMSL